MNWDLATDVILYASFAMLAVFACLGLVQLIQRKSLKKVDKPILAMLVPLVLIVVTYIIFDKILIWNTRPDGSGEPSFPSTHVMVVATIFAIIALALPKYLKKSTYLTVDAVMLIFLIITAVGRVLANKHWPSDVIGGLIFAGLFTLIYYLIIRRNQNANQHPEPSTKPSNK